MAILNLAYKSLLSRKTSVIFTLLTLAISVLLLLTVERVRVEAKQSFANTISGTDLVVGARSGQINLLLYSVFRIGNATNNIDWRSYQDIIQDKAVKWAIPISLGDSHQGFRVVGTNTSYFEHYQYGKKQALTFLQGHEFNGLFDAVIGSEVAQELGYKIGSPMVLAHGMQDTGFSRHDNMPFKVVGILAPTGTPVDKSIHVSLEAIEAIHIGWESGANVGHAPNQSDVLSLADSERLQPKQITAVLLGLTSKIQTFKVQRAINTYKAEPLSAILPGIALQELWSMLSIVEQALLVISGLVVIAGMFGMLSTLVASLRERKQEIRILRAMGARRKHIFSLLICEASLLTFLAIVLGVIGLYCILWLAGPFIQTHYGIKLGLAVLSEYEWLLLGCVQLLGVVIGIFPAIGAYRQGS